MPVFFTKFYIDFIYCYSVFLKGPLNFFHYLCFSIAACVNF